MNSMVHFFLFSLYHQYTLSSRWSPENSGRRGISCFRPFILTLSSFLSLRFSALLLSTLAPYCLLPALQRFPAIYRLLRFSALLLNTLAQYSCSILNHEGYPLNFNI